jgi:hypothetical protein
MKASLYGRSTLSKTISSPLKPALRSVFGDGLTQQIIDILPQAYPDTFFVNEDELLSGNVSGNDTLGDGPNTFSLVSDVVNGTLTFSSNGSFTYQPTLNFNGSDSFTYRITDANGDKSEATVTITVGAVNDLPVSVIDSVSTAYEQPVTIDILANDYDLDGTIDPTSVEVITQPSNGLVSIDGVSGEITYTPNTLFYGQDEFQYRVADDQGAWSEPVAVSLDVAQLTRYFTYLKESGGMYYQLSEGIDFADFEWEFDLMPEDDGDFHQVIAGSSFVLNYQAEGSQLFFNIGGPPDIQASRKA